MAAAASHATLWLFVAVSLGGFVCWFIGETIDVFTIGFARFASNDDLFALSLAVSAFNLLARIPMGLAMGTPLAEGTVGVKREFTMKHKPGEPERRLVT